MTPMEHIKEDWIILHDGTDGRGLRYECTRCGRVYAPALPLEVEVFVALSKAFTRHHKRCRPSGESRASSEIETRIAAAIESGA